MDDEVQFDWPCDRRDAHGPHDAYVFLHPDEYVTCPGVKAHPLCMIGKS